MKDKCSLKGLWLCGWVFNGNICEQCKGYNGCPKFNCKILGKARMLSGRQWTNLANKYVFEYKDESNNVCLDVDDKANLFKDLQKIKIPLRRKQYESDTNEH